MARVAKIDNGWKKRFDREEKKRSTNNRNQRVYFLIVCEGEKTEPNYFISFEKELPIGTVKIEIHGTGKNTLSLVEYAIKKRESSVQKFDRVWVVFDKDNFSDHDFNAAVSKGLTNNIKCAWSNEAFELWFLLHFQFVNTAMKRHEYKPYLEKEIKKLAGNGSYEYKKNDPNTFLLLKEHGNQEQAIQRAKKLLQLFTDEKFATHNPCTRVHELIEELISPEKILKEIQD